MLVSKCVKIPWSTKLRLGRCATNLKKTKLNETYFRRNIILLMSANTNSTVAFSMGRGSEPKHRTNLFFHQQTAALMGALNCARGFISQLAANHGHLAYGYHRLLGYIGIATPQVPPHNTTTCKKNILISIPPLS